MHKFHEWAKWTLIAISVLGIARTTEATDDTVRAQFLKDYGDGLRKLETRYSQIRGSGTLIVESLGDPNHPIADAAKRPKTVSHVEFRFDGARQWLLMRSISPKPGVTSISCSTDEHSFRVDRKAPDADPTLTSLEGGKDSNIAKSIERFRASTLDTPFSASRPIRVIMGASDQYRVKSVTPQTKDGHKVLRVEYQRVIKRPESTVTWDCHFLLNVDKGLALQEYANRAGPFKRGATVEYGKLVDGVPVLKKIVLTAPEEIRTLELDDFEFAPSPAELFTPEAAGMPKIGKL